MAKYPNGRPQAVGELIVVMLLDKTGTTGFSNVQMRGVTDDAQPGFLKDVLDIAAGGMPVDELCERTLVAPQQLTERWFISLRNLADELLIRPH